MNVPERKMRLMEMAVQITAATISADAKPTDFGNGEHPGNTKKFLRAVYKDLEAMWAEVAHAPPP